MKMMACSAVAENNVSFLWLKFFIRILEARRAVNLVRNMEVVDLRSMIQGCQPVPSTSGGAGGISSRCFHSTSGGRVVADSAVRLSEILAMFLERNYLHPLAIGHLHKWLICRLHEF